MSNITPPESDALKIGSTYAGGIVFYLDETGNHGLVCAKENFGIDRWYVDKESEWSYPKNKKIGASGKGVADGSGIRNTKIIVDEASWFIDQVIFDKTEENPFLSVLRRLPRGYLWKVIKKPAPTAARLCLESNHNGFTDWYLPTIRELVLMYENLKENNNIEIKSDYYWSSSEYSYDKAWGYGFGYGENSLVTWDKISTLQVRAVRAF
jgi:hypothetical protein